MNLLRRCPHCNGVVITYRGFGGLRIFRCQTCKALTVFEEVVDEEKAIELWNRRSDELQ